MTPTKVEFRQEILRRQTEARAKEAERKKRAEIDANSYFAEMCAKSRRDPQNNGLARMRKGNRRSGSYGGR